MTLNDSALLEMIEMLRTANGGELMRRHRAGYRWRPAGAARSGGRWWGRARCGNAPASTRTLELVVLAPREVGRRTGTGCRYAR